MMCECIHSCTTVDSYVTAKCVEVEFCVLPSNLISLRRAFIQHLS